jgi:hypothetical protein
MNAALGPVLHWWGYIWAGSNLGNEANFFPGGLQPNALPIELRQVCVNNIPCIHDYRVNNILCIHDYRTFRQEL